MWYRLETYFSLKYSEIYEKYHSVLDNYEIKEEDNRMLIKVDSVETLFQLDNDLREYWEQKDIDDYFGILLSHDEGREVIEIKDAFD